MYNLSDSKLFWTYDVIDILLQRRPLYHDITRSPVDSPHKRVGYADFIFFFLVSLKKLLNKMSRRQ